MSRKVNLSICLSTETLEQIDRQAKEQGLSRSAAIEKKLIGVSNHEQTLTGINNQAPNGLGQDFNSILNSATKLLETQQATAVALKSISRQNGSGEQKPIQNEEGVGKMLKEIKDIVEDMNLALGDISTKIDNIG